jgi:hypothetical protein
VDGALERPATTGPYVRWSTIGLVAAVLFPLLTAAAGYGALYQRVGTLADASEKAERREADMNAAITSLNVSVAKLSGAVDALTRKIPDSRGNP